MPTLRPIHAEKDSFNGDALVRRGSRYGLVSVRGAGATAGAVALERP